MKREALRKEGLTDEQITVEKDFIVSDDSGFITYRFEHGFPYITHALVYPDKRSGWTWLRLFNQFKKEVMDKGYSAFIAEVIEGKEFFERILKRLGTSRPYAVNDNGKYFLVKFKE